MAEELTKKLFDFLHELSQKKEESEQLQQHCHAEHLSKQELSAENESLKVEVNNLRVQLDFTNKVLHKYEENFKGATEEGVKHKLGLEAASRLGDKMKEEAIRLQNENMSLKKRIEQLEKETKTESFYRESCISKQSKMQATIESLTKQMRGLEKDFREVERKSNTTLSIGNKSKLLIENKEHIIKQMQEKIEHLSTQNTTLTSKITMLELKEKENRPVEQRYGKEILKEWQNALNEMKIRTQSFEKESETLHQTLEKAHKDVKKCQEFEELANGKVRELEAKLEEVKRGVRRMCTDCSVQTDLTMSIEVGCQTTGTEVDHTETRTSHTDLQDNSELPTQLNTKLILQ